MAGRIRSVKPEILEDEKTAGLTHLEWRLFVSLWLIADDYGNLRGEPNYVLGQCLWASRESRETVAKALETLAGLALVTPYTVRGQSYIAITNWDKHQKIDHKGKPRMPLLSMADSDTRETLAKSSRDSLETLAPDLRSPISDQDQRSGDDIAAPPLQLQPDPPEPKRAPRSTRKKPNVPMPDGWQPRDRERGKAAELGLNCDREAERFRDHHTARGSTFADWDAAFRTWIGNAQRFRSGNGAVSPPQPVRIAPRDDDDYSRIPGMEAS